MSNRPLPLEISNALEEILSAPQVFTPSRYPNTYAFDMLRSHPAEFCVPAGLTRGDADTLMKDRYPKAEEREKILEALADGFLQLHHISKA